jgi:hypothetical protein
VTEKIRVDVSEMTLREMAEAVEAAGNPDAAGFNFRQTAALAMIVQRRTDPTFTLEQALELKIGELDIVEAAPEVPGGSTGVLPPLSAVSGMSDPRT